MRRFLQDLSQYKKGNFNPRTHIGCDYLHSQASKLAYHFNPRTIVGQDVVCPHFLVPLFNSVIDYCTSQEEATVFSGNSEMIEYTIEGFNEGRYQLIGVDAR